MHPYKRSARVSDLLREEVADIVMHKLKDPRLGFITVTGAKVSDDLRHSIIFISVLEDSKQEETLRILGSSARFIRNELSRRIKMKFIPDLVFRLDESIRYGAKIDRLLDEVKPAAENPESDESSS
jgi:ribosome-binding factor A